MRNSMIKNFIIFLIPVLMILISCSGSEKSASKIVFGTMPDGQEIYLFTLKNENGMKAKIINYGATVVSLTVPDRNGEYEDVILGYDTLKQYIDGTSYFGGIVGRYGNRIGKGKFTLDGKEYQVTVNNGENHLHGGEKGYNKVVWDAKLIDPSSLSLTYHSVDGEEGYPGNVTLNVIYSLTKNNGLKINYSGTTDATTILNPTNHCYFNLTGNPKHTILDHMLFIDADKYTPVDDGLIPTGELADVAGTPMDFREPTKIGARISDDFMQLVYGKGYDHNWVLNNYNGQVRQVATLSDSLTGRKLEVLTDQPGLQFYSGNFLNGSDIGKGGIKYRYRTGLCLEAQCYPDSPNNPDFPSVTLKPGEVYHQTTIYQFTTDK